MKKNRLITPIVTLTTLTGSIPVVSLSSCSKTVSNVELDKSVVDLGVSVKSSKLAKYQDSTIELVVPEGKWLSSAKLKIDNSILTPPTIRVFDNTITINAEQMIAEKITIQSVALKDNISDLSVSGKRNIDITDTTMPITFTAKDENGNDISSSCAFSIDDSSLGTFENNVFTLSEKAKKIGGSARITATHNISKISSNIFDIEIASFGKLITDFSDYSLINGIANCNSNATGFIVIPSRYYFNDDTGWIETKAIKSSGMSAEGITGVHIPSSIVYIGSKPFNSALETIDIDPNNQTYTSLNNNCVINKATLQLVYGCKSTIIPTDPKIVTSIGEDAFYKSLFTKMSIPQNIKSIGARAFSDCSLMESITFEGTPAIDSLKDGTFSNCSSLTSITIPATVTSIGKECFKNCNSLTSVTFAIASKPWAQSGKDDLIDLKTPASNATKLRNVSQTEANNWGNTGIQQYTFAYASWKYVDQKAFAFEGTADAKALCNSFADIEYHEGKTVQEQMSDFLGKEKKLTLNGKEHVFKVIGICHDVYEEDGVVKYKFAFTFQSQTLLSDYNGDFLTTTWDTYNHYSYTSSCLYNVLNSNNDVTWYDHHDKLSDINSSVLTMLKAQGFVPREVTKSVALSSPLVSTKYNCSCFPLSHNEFTEQRETRIPWDEGRTYDYWKGHDEKYRIFKDVNNNSYEYWTSSPTIVPEAPQEDETSICTVSNGRFSNFTIVHKKLPVSFCFVL